MYNGRVGAVGSPKKPDARREAPLPTHSPSTPVGRSVFHSTGQDQQKDDPAAGAEVREEVLEERMKFGHAAIIPEGGLLDTRNPQGNGTDINLTSSKRFLIAISNSERKEGKAEYVIRRIRSNPDRKRPLVQVIFRSAHRQKFIQGLVLGSNMGPSDFHTPRNGMISPGVAGRIRPDAIFAAGVRACVFTPCNSGPPKIETGQGNPFSDQFALTIRPPIMAHHFPIGILLQSIELVPHAKAAKGETRSDKRRAMLDRPFRDDPGLVI